MIVVGGEALYDLVLQGTAEDLSGHPGGAAFNTARTIGRLEQPVAYLGRLSSDRFGRRLESLLVEDGVDLGSVVRTDEPTTLALAEVDDDGVASYRFYERGTAAIGLMTEAALDALPPQVDMLHVGTLGLALEPVATALEAVVARLSSTALVAVDPNCRPWVVADVDAYRERIRRVLGHAHVLKVSEEDLEFLSPAAPRSKASGRCSRTARPSACSRAGPTERWSSPARPRSPCRRRVPRWSTRSAPAMRSAAVSWPGGASAASAARSSARSTWWSRRPSSPASWRHERALARARHRRGGTNCACREAGSRLARVE